MSINYKPILPSGLMTEMDESDMNYIQKLNNDMSLRVGVVLEAYEPEDKENNKYDLGPEYRVMVVNKENVSVYDNCRMIDGFGGIADFYEKKARPVEDKKKVTESGDINDNVGNIVLLICLESDAERPIILGSLQNTKRKTILNEEKGLHMEGEFNGVRYSVDKDGALTVTFKSKTDSKGKPKSIGKEAGSQFKIEKDGSIEVNTAPITPELSGGNDIDAKPGSENKEPSANLEYDRIRLDRPSKSIQIEARENIDMVADKDLTALVEENIDLQMKKDLLIKAEGKANVEITGNVDFKTDANVKAKMMNLQMTIDNAAQIQLQTLQLTGQQLTVNGGSGLLLTCAQTLVNSPLVILGTQPQPALIPNTSFLGIGNLGVPVISTAIGPFSSQVMLSS